jgi:hypothetical protein
MFSAHRRRALSASTPWLVAVGVLLGSSGCNQILGIEKAELDSSTGGSSSGGGTGSGGSSGGPATCDPYETGDIGLVRGCLLRISCDPLLPYYSMSECVSYAYQLANPQELCTYGATSCADIEQCLGRRMVDPDSCAHSSGWECYGDQAVLCGVTVPYATDCTNGGTSCYMPPSFPGEGSRAPCLADGGTCSDAPGAVHCDGNILYECIDGSRYGRDCAAAGSTCVEEVSGEATCIDSTTACATPDSVECNGNVLTYCGSSGLRSVLDCSTAGLTCESSGTYADCVAPGCGLQDVSDCTESCDGAVLRYCIGGAQAQVDCSEFGFSTCELATVNGFPLAYCSGEAPPGFDTCVWARDGACDEPSLCEPGTDTTDCAG